MPVSFRLVNRFVMRIKRFVSVFRLAQGGNAWFAAVQPGRGNKPAAMWIRRGSASENARILPQNNN